MEAVATFLPPFCMLPSFPPHQKSGLHFRHTDNTVQWLRAMESIGLPKVSLDWEDSRAGTDTSLWEGVRRMAEQPKRLRKKNEPGDIFLSDFKLHPGPAVTTTVPSLGLSLSGNTFTPVLPGGLQEIIERV